MTATAQFCINSPLSDLADKLIEAQDKMGPLQPGAEMPHVCMSARHDSDKGTAGAAIPTSVVTHFWTDEKLKDYKRVLIRHIPGDDSPWCGNVDIPKTVTKMEKLLKVFDAVVFHMPSSRDQGRAFLEKNNFHNLSNVFGLWDPAGEASLAFRIGYNAYKGTPPRHMHLIAPKRGWSVWEVRNVKEGDTTVQKVVLVHMKLETDEKTGKQTNAACTTSDPEELLKVVAQLDESAATEAATSGIEGLSTADAEAAHRHTADSASLESKKS